MLVYSLTNMFHHDGAESSFTVVLSDGNKIHEINSVEIDYANEMVVLRHNLPRVTIVSTQERIEKSGGKKNAK